MIDGDRHGRCPAGIQLRLWSPLAFPDLGSEHKENAPGADLKVLSEAARDLLVELVTASELTTQRLQAKGDTSLHGQLVHKQDIAAYSPNERRC